MTGAADVPLTRPRLAAGSVDVSALVEREAVGVLAYFVRRVAVREDAADLLGETLVVVWRRRDDIPVDEVGARMWLFGVARRILLTHRRGARRREALDGALRLELAAHAPADVEAEAIARDLLAVLPERDQEILRLSFWEGFSQAEIAGILGMRATSVRSRHARALARLRAIVDDRYDREP